VTIFYFKKTIFYGAWQAAEHLGLKVISIPEHEEHGIDLEAFKDAIERYPIHFRKKILAKLEEGQSIRAVAQHFEINKNTIVEWKKRIEIKRTRPRKPSKVDDDALRADVEQYPDDYQYERAARFGCATSTIGDALKRLNITVKKRPYGTRKQKQNSESSI
jgi:transposase